MVDQQHAANVLAVEPFEQLDQRIALRPPEAPAASRKATAAKAKSAAKASPEKPPPPRPVDPAKPAPPYVQITREDFAAGDISKLPSRKGEGETGTQTAGGAYGPGEGPNGAPLYTAEWYREPTPGELALYLKKDVPPNSSAMIMCQTAPDYRVENCRGLGESPPGSGLASALRQAAWQFKLRPPRRGSEALIGVCVRIRFDWVAR